MEDFNKPQRQSKIGIIAHFLYTLQKLLRAIVPMLIIILLRADNTTRLYFILGSVGLCLVLLFVAYLRYTKFLFYIREESQEFVIEKGILNRSKIMIKLNKIQQVNINQSFVQKLVGVFAVEIDSAGSSAKEVVIDSISYEVALALKEKLLFSSDETAVGEAELESSEEKRPIKTTKIGLVSLIKVGLTSHYIKTFLVILLFLNTMYERIHNFMGDQFELDSEQMEKYVNQYWLGYIVIVLAIVAILAVLIINLIRTLYRFYNFTIVKQSNSLLLSFGLLATRSTIIKPNRVQVVKIVQNYFQKKWDILQIHIRQTSGDELDKENKKSALEIPGCSTSEKEDLFQMIYGQQPIDGIVLRSSNRFFWLRFFMLGVFPIAVFSIFFLEYFESIVLYALPLYLLLVTAVSYRMYKVRTLYVHPDFILVKKGFWDISKEIIQPHKIQKIETSQLFWQQSSDVGSLQLYTAGGILSFNTTQYSEIRKRVDFWLYQIESSNRNWM